MVDRMPFGKYSGKALKDIPIDYLVWVYQNCKEIRLSLRSAIYREVTRRSSGQEKDDATPPLPWR